VTCKKIECLITGITTMVPTGHQGYPKATTGTPKGDRVDHNRTTPSMEEDRICYLNWVTHTRGLSLRGVTCSYYSRWPF